VVHSTALNSSHNLPIYPPDITAQMTSIGGQGNYPSVTLNVAVKQLQALEA